MGEWKEYKLEDVAEITSSKRIFFSDYVSSGIPFYRSKEIIEKANGISINTELFITPNRYFEIKEKFGAPSDGDILISAVGERAGIPYCVNNDGDFYFKDGNLIWFRKFRKDFSPEFLVYYFKSFVGRQSLESTMIGSAQKALTIIGLKGLQVKFPSYNEQTQIASILSNLDNKIDLLHRQNKTLEALAETLFRQWFVEEAEEGWETGKLGDYVEFVKGKKPKEAVEEYSIGLTPQILIETFDTGKTLFSESQNMVIANEKDILMVMDGASSGRAEIGFTGIVGSTIGLFKPISSFNYPLFIFYLLKASESHIREHTTGSAIPHADKALILGLDIQYPSIERVIEFENMAEIWFEKKKANRNQIRALTRLRDTLLPKLMSGEVRVRDAERFEKENL